MYVKFAATLCTIITVIQAEEIQNFYKSELFQNDSKIYFHHIPKTAGITTRSFLSKNLLKPMGEIVVSQNATQLLFPVSSDNEEFKVSLESSLQDSGVLSTSNTSFIYLKDYADNCNVMTILRDPVSRHLSHIRFFSFLKSQSPQLYDIVASADNYLTHSSKTYNFQTLYLSSLDPYDSSITLEQHLESAKYNLKYKIAFFGLSELLPESLYLYLYRMNIETTVTCEHLNATCHIKELDFDYDYEDLKKKNWADVELYNFAKALFFERYPFLENIYTARLSQNPLFIYPSSALSDHETVESQANKATDTLKAQPSLWEKVSGYFWNLIK